MATMRDIVTKALQLIRVVGATESPTAEDAADGLDTANGIFEQFQARDIFAGTSTLALDDEFPLAERHRMGFIAYLASHLAPNYGVEIGMQVERRASLGWQLIAADYFAPESLRVDLGLQRMPSQRLP